MGINSRATGVVGGCRGKALRASNGTRPMGVNIRATGVVGGYRGTGVGRPDKSAVRPTGGPVRWPSIFVQHVMASGSWCGGHVNGSKANQ